MVNPSEAKAHSTNFVRDLAAMVAVGHSLLSPSPRHGQIPFSDVHDEAPGSKPGGRVSTRYCNLVDTQCRVDFAAALPSDQKKKKPTLPSGSQFMTWKAQVLRNLRLESVVKSAPDAFEISQEHAQGGRLKPPLITDNTSLPIHATTSAERRRTCSHQLLATAPP